MANVNESAASAPRNPTLPVMAGLLAAMSRFANPARARLGGLGQRFVPRAEAPVDIRPARYGCHGWGEPLQANRGVVEFVHAA